MTAARNPWFCTLYATENGAALLRGGRSHVVATATVKFSLGEREQVHFASEEEAREALATELEALAKAVRDNVKQDT